MAARQAIEPRAPLGRLRAVGLAATLVCAKALALVGHAWPRSPWTPFALFWQDALVALIWAAVETTARPVVLVRSLYVAVVAYIAINVPVTRVLGSPMTRTMWHAAGGAMSDSMRHELTLANVSAVGAVIAVAVLVPRWTSRGRWRPGWGTLAAASLFVAIGVPASRRVDAGGRDRNAIGALLPIPVVAAVSPPDGDLRRSLFGPPPEDLKALRGAGRGLNVVMVVLESTAARYLRLYGAAADPTPHLTALGQTGVVFENAYAVYPESIRELLAWLCARDPAYGATAAEDAAMPCASIADRLKAAGYRTALFHSGRFDYLDMRAVVEGRGFDTLADAAAIGGRVHSSFGVSERATVERLLAWVDARRAGQPFFVAYLPIAGHHPYATEGPGPFDGRTEAGQYLNALHEGDAALGTLIAGLRTRGLDDQTMFVVFGDHGEAFGQHDGNTGHSLFIYDENVRVPLIVRIPHGRPTRVGRPVSVVDIEPTVLDLVGVKGAPDLDGVSMLDRATRLSFFFTDYSRPWVGLRDGCWKYLLDIDAGRSRLFDVCADPGEATDRSAELALDERAYRQRAMQWLAQTQSVFTRSVPRTSKPSR
jgi:arylsulfatase A-like enzyme